MKKLNEQSEMYTRTFERFSKLKAECVDATAETALSLKYLYHACDLTTEEEGLSTGFSVF